MANSGHTQVAIIGSGPAGWTAALYTARADLAPVVFEGLQPGGQLTITTEVENYPGFPDGVMGPELMTLFKNQATRFGVQVHTENVESVDFSSRPFRIKGSETEVTADAVIISTGASAMYLGIPGEDDFHNKGLSACATCDGFFFRGKDVVVVGGGDTAVEEATFLTKFCDKVMVVHRRDALRASKPMQARLFANEKIGMVWNSVLTEYFPDEDGKIRGVLLKDTVTGEEREVECQGVFMGIGHKPNTSIFSGMIDLNDTGYIETIPGTSRTNIEGVFACGDVQDHVYRQAITAAGSGCMAAMDSERWLEEQD